MDQLLYMDEKLPLSTFISFEIMVEENHHNYVSLLDNHLEGKRILLSPRSILGMRIEKGELPWSDLRLTMLCLFDESFL